MRLKWKRPKTLKNTFIGIDLGTTFSAVAVAELSHEEEWGVRNLSLLDPHSQRACKLLSTVVDYSNLSYPSVGDEGGRFAIRGFQFKLKVGTGDPLLLPSGQQIYPEEPAVEVLKYLRDQIVKQLWKGGVPRWEESVVTLAVPAAPMNERQWSKRIVTFRGIAHKAGFPHDVVEIVGEPIAALLDIMQAEDGLDLSDKTILVVDYGGGTCDVAIVRTGQRRLFVDNRQGEILSVASKECGGVYIDQSVANWMKQNGQVVRGERALEDAREIKETLCGKDERKKRKKIDEVGLTYETFLELSRPVIAQLGEVTSHAIDEAELKKGKGITIDRVVLTGGGSKHPLVEESVKEYFNRYYGSRVSVVLAQHPQLNVSRGAARYGLHKFIYQLPFYEEARFDLLWKFPDGQEKRLVRKGQRIPFKKPNRSAYRIAEGIQNGLVELPLYYREEKGKEYQGAVAHLDFGQKIDRGRTLILEVSVQLDNRVYVKGVVPGRTILEADTMIYLDIA